MRACGAGGAEVQKVQKVHGREQSNPPEGKKKKKIPQPQPQPQPQPHKWKVGDYSIFYWEKGTQNIVLVKKRKVKTTVLSKP